MKQVKGRVVITRSSNHSIHITVSGLGCELVEVKLTKEQFAEAVTAQLAEAELKVFNTYDIIDKELQSKTEVIKIKEDTHKALRETWYKDKNDVLASSVMDKIFSKYEVDGWKARRDDIFNHHNRVGKDEYRVVFQRYV